MRFDRRCKVNIDNVKMNPRKIGHEV